MRIALRPRLGHDYVARSQEDPEVFARLNALIDECLRDPFGAPAGPNPLGDSSAEHRLVYRATGMGEGQALEVLSRRYHY